MNKQKKQKHQLFIVFHNLQKLNITRQNGILIQYPCLVLRQDI